MSGTAAPSELLNGIPVKEKGFFTASDGTPIYYEVGGGTGKTLLFCYGLVCRREHWHYQLKHFAEDYQLVTFDYRGHHRSGIPKNDQNLTLSRCVQDTVELMDYLKLKEVVAFGHSLGVPVATQLAQRDPKRVKGAVLICGCVSNPFQGMFYTNYMDKVFEFSAKLFKLSPRWTSQIWSRFTDINRISVFMTSRLGFNPSLSEERDVHLYMDGVKQIPFHVFYRLLSDYRNYDGRSGLRGIETPTLVIAGSDDVITPRYLQEEMARLLPKSELEIIPLGSHNAHMDLPEMVNQKIDNFLNRIKYS